MLFPESAFVLKRKEEASALCAKNVALQPRKDFFLASRSILSKVGLQYAGSRGQRPIRIPDRKGRRKKDGNNSVSFSSACTSCRSHHTMQRSLELRQELQENGWYYRSNKTRPNTDFVETPNGRRLKTCKGCRERRTTKEQAKKAETRETNLAANAAAPKICEICTMARDASEFDDLSPERLL